MLQSTLPEILLLVLFVVVLAGCITVVLAALAGLRRIAAQLAEDRQERRAQDEAIAKHAADEARASTLLAEAQTELIGVQTRAAEAQQRAAEAWARGAEAQQRAAEAQVRAAEAQQRLAEAEASRAARQAELLEADAEGREVSAESAPGSPADGTDATARWNDALADLQKALGGMGGLSGFGGLGDLAKWGGAGGHGRTSDGGARDASNGAQPLDPELFDRLPEEIRKMLRDLQKRRGSDGFEPDVLREWLSRRFGDWADGGRTDPGAGGGEDDSSASAGRRVGFQPEPESPGEDESWSGAETDPPAGLWGIDDAGATAEDAAKFGDSRDDTSDDVDAQVSDAAHGSPWTGGIDVNALIEEALRDRGRRQGEEGSADTGSQAPGEAATDGTAPEDPAPEDAAPEDDDDDLRGASGRED